MVSHFVVERERELAERLYYEECVDSARELVLAHLRFVVHIAGAIQDTDWWRQT